MKSIMPPLLSSSSGKSGGLNPSESSEIQNSHLNGCETWKLMKEDLRKLNVLHLNCCQRILNVYWWTKTSNMGVYRISCQHPVSEMIKVRRWRYLGHTLSRQASIPHTRLGWAREGKRRKENLKGPGEWRPLISCAVSAFSPGKRLQRWQKIGRSGGSREWTPWRNMPLGILQPKSCKS